MFDEGDAAQAGTHVSVEQAQMSDRALNHWKSKFVEEALEVALERKK